MNFFTRSRRGPKHIEERRYDIIKIGWRVSYTINRHRGTIELLVTRDLTVMGSASDEKRAVARMHIVAQELQRGWSYALNVTDVRNHGISLSFNGSSIPSIYLHRLNSLMI